MNRGVYAAATGMIAAEQWQEAVAHNLANASTAGFKKEQLSFNEALLRTVYADGGSGEPIGQIGNGAKIFGRFIKFDVGVAQMTGNPLNAAIRTEKGMFAVETPNGTRYTRNGSFSLNADRELVTLSNLPVLDATGQRIRIPIGAESPRLTDQGQLVSEAGVIATVGMFDGTFARIGDTLFASGDAQAMPQADLIPFAVESSNVNAVEEMIHMIKLNRAFEMSQKSAQTQDESTGRLIESVNKQ